MAAGGVPYKTTDIPGPAIARVCTQQVFDRLFKALINACAIPEENEKQIHAMFSSCTTRNGSPLVSSCPEAALTFWAFPPSDDAWYATQRFLLKILRPRIYQAAETRLAQREMCMVVPLKPLMITPGLFESWMDKFAEHVGMSAGCLTFAEYFGPQMLSSIMRIGDGRKIFSNFPCQFHKDFSMLFGKMAHNRMLEERVRGVTGLNYTGDTFVNLALENKKLKSVNRTLSADASKWARLRATMPQLSEVLDIQHESVGELSVDACIKIRDIIDNDAKSRRENSSPSVQHTAPETQPPASGTSRADIWDSMMNEFQQRLQRGPQAFVPAHAFMPFTETLIFDSDVVRYSPLPQETE